MKNNRFLIILFILLIAHSIEAQNNRKTARKVQPRTEISNKRKQKLQEKIISGGVVNGKAILLFKPAYPAAARLVNVRGSVSVSVLIDEEGNVIEAEAVSGHPLLKAASVDAALRSKFMPVNLGGNPVKVSGVIVYRYVIETYN